MQGKTIKNALTGILGGMFDPVHCGHLAAAQAARERCGLEKVILVPCGNPVHRSDAMATAQQRIEMLALAAAGMDWLEIDTRECRSAGPSRSHDTLQGLQAELPQTVFVLIVGMDAFQTFNTWYHWQDIFNLAHVAVITRPGYVMQKSWADPVFQQECMTRLAAGSQNLVNRKAGGLFLVEADTPDLSSSRIRKLLETGTSVDNIVPSGVLAYIRQHALYH